MVDGKLVSVKQKNSYLPINFNISLKAILLIGGGHVALQKLKLLIQFTNNITVLAPKITAEITKTGVTCLHKPYSFDDLEAFQLVYACTSDLKSNQQIYSDCQKKKILVNVVDNPGLSDFISPAIYQKDEMTVAVSSGGTNVRKAINWRNLIREYFDNATRSLSLREMDARRAG